MIATLDGKGLDNLLDEEIEYGKLVMFAGMEVPFVGNAVLEVTGPVGEVVFWLAG